METHAAPRPWLQGTDPRHVITKARVIIAECSGEPTAALIVRAVNRDRHVAPLVEALRGLVAATANVIDVGPAYDQAVRVLDAAEEAAG